VRWCKVSPEAALRDYGVVLTGSGDDLAYDEEATFTERAGRGHDGLDRQATPFFDRGPGYARLAGGAAYADVDVLP
jgi:N-methylhydantoinase B